MKQVRKNGAGIHISAGLSGYIAELGAAFLCADLALELTPRPDHASYIESWLTVHKDDRRLIFTAAAHAQRAADFLHRRQVSEAR